MSGAEAGALDPDARRRALERIASGELDLLIVGGGITGAGAALDAAARGLKVGLLEATDIAAGASSKSSKLIHGGLRYLEMGDFGLVRESLRERELLLSRLAPHLVSAVPFMWPLRGRGWERLYLGAGMVLYDTIGGARSVPRHRHLTRRRALTIAPALAPGSLIGAVQFHDACEDDARMALTVARTAAAYGAQIATRVRVGSLRCGGGRVTGVEALDSETGEELELRARHVALAVGAWTGGLRSVPGVRYTTEMRPSKGIHITVAREAIPMSTGLLVRTEKSVLFVIPADYGWLIGDTDTPWRHDVELPVATGADIDYVLSKCNEWLARPLTRADVRGVFAGVRPLVGPASTADTTRLSRNHVIETPLPGLTTIAGGKYTTYRVMAADLVDAATRELPGVPRSRTAEIPLLGAAGYQAARADAGVRWRELGVSPAGFSRLLHRYGARIAELERLIRERPELAEELPGGEGVLAAEVIHACTHELALHLEDVLERRTRLSFSSSDRGARAAAAAAALMASALGWRADRVEHEVASWQRRLAAERAAQAQRDDASALRAYHEALRAPVSR